MLTQLSIIFTQVAMQQISVSPISGQCSHLYSVKTLENHSYNIVQSAPYHRFSLPPNTFSESRIKTLDYCQDISS